MVDNLVFLWLAALPLMGSPGPATLSVAGVGTAFGFRKGVPYALGIVVGTVSVLVMIATGVTALILAQPALVTGLSLVAGAYILYLAWKIATAPVGPIDAASEKPPLFLPGFLLAVANPKAFAAIGAVYAGHTLVAGDVVADALAKILALTCVIVVVDAVWLVLGATFARALSDPVIGRAANVSFAVLLLLSVVLVFATN